MPKRKANIRLKKNVAPVTALGWVNIGNYRESIYLPAGRYQRAGWFEEQAATLAKQYPDRYETTNAAGEFPKQED